MCSTQNLGDCCEWPFLRWGISFPPHLPWYFNEMRVTCHIINESLPWATATCSVPFQASLWGCDHWGEGSLGDEVGIEWWCFPLLNKIEVTTIRTGFVLFCMQGLLFTKHVCGHIVAWGVQSTWGVMWFVDTISQLFHYF